MAIVISGTTGIDAGSLPVNDCGNTEVEITEEDFNKIVYEVNNPPLTEEQLLAQQKAEAKQYLNSTDWCVTRKIETGAAIPEDVIVKRAECRVLL